MATDTIRAELERLQGEKLYDQSQLEHTVKSPTDKVKVQSTARQYRSGDKVRKARTRYQTQAVEAQEQYEKQAIKAQTKARKKAQQRVPQTGDWKLEGVYHTRADVDQVKKQYKRDGYFTRVVRLKDGGYNLWIKEGAEPQTGKGKGKDKDDYELIDPHDYRWSEIKTIKGQNKIIKAGAETTGRMVSNLTSFGTVPKYEPPNMKFDVAGQYKPLEYKPVESKPMFDMKDSYKPMEYKYLEPPKYGGSDYKGISTEPYYKPSEYKPIGQFGGNVKPVALTEEKVKTRKKSGSWNGVIKVKRKKTKHTRLVGVK